MMLFPVIKNDGSKLEELLMQLFDQTSDPSSGYLSSSSDEGGGTVHTIQFYLGEMRWTP